MDNTYRGSRRDDRDALGGRVVLCWFPAPDWEIEAGVEAARAQDGSSRFVRLEEPFGARSPAYLGGRGPFARDQFQVRSDEEGSLNLHQHREWLSIAKRFET